jgi:Urm1 (Ubiquitin related modifier)
VRIPEATDAPMTMARVLQWVRDHCIVDRPELFMDGDDLYVEWWARQTDAGERHRARRRSGEGVCRRPGILCLVNEADWELEGMGECVVRSGDRIAFISTLHGG